MHQVPADIQTGSAVFGCDTSRWMCGQNLCTFPEREKEKQDVGAGEQLAVCNCVLCRAFDHPYFKLPKRGLL